jgi:hypothetical protein
VAFAGAARWLVWCGPVRGRLLRVMRVLFLTSRWFLRLVLLAVCVVAFAVAVLGDSYVALARRVANGAFWWRCGVRSAGVGRRTGGPRRQVKRVGTAVR